MRANTIVFSMLMAAGCGRIATGPEAEPAGGAAPAAERRPAVARGAGFVVHEWGTFTSVQDSTGRQREGLHHEEEALPWFVHGRDIGSPFGKAMETLPAGVTQKLETPVIYFYAGERMDVRVEVGFPQGVVSEWYPAASSFSPAVGTGLLPALGDGRMAWDVTLNPGPTAPPDVAPDDVWAPSRRVGAAPLTAAGEDELFIFYRGLGRFRPPLRVESVSETELRIGNESDDAVPALFLLHVHDGGGSVVPLGGLAPRSSVIAAPTPKEQDMDAYVESAKSLVAAALENTGLYVDESRAMVETWSRSYFRTPGLRLLYVVPRTWTDALLPLRVEPAPDELVRTLVGRVEVLTPGEEAALASEVEEAARTGRTLVPAELGRFAEPRLRRAVELVSDVASQSLCRRLIEEAAAMP